MPMNRGVIVTDAADHGCAVRWFVGVMTATTKRASTESAARVRPELADPAARAGNDGQAACGPVLIGHPVGGCPMAGAGKAVPAIGGAVRPG